MTGSPILSSSVVGTKEKRSGGEGERTAVITEVTLDSPQLQEGGYKSIQLHSLIRGNGC